MRYLMDIAWKDIRQILRDRMSLLFLLIMPIAFTLMFSFAFNGSGSTTTDSRLPVGVVDLDHSRLSAGLIDFMLNSQVVRLEEKPDQTEAKLEKQVANQQLAAAVIIPAGYGDSVRGGIPLKVSLVVDANTSAGLAARGAVLAAANRAANAGSTARIIQNKLGSSYEAALTRVVEGWQQPPVSLQITQAAAAVKPASISSGPMSAASSSPGMMVQFAIAGLITAGQMLVNERKSNCLQRLLTTAVARPQILMGHFLAMFTITFCQLVILVLFGQLALQLNYLRQPLAVLVMITATALFIAGLGLLIGALAKTDDQAVLFAMIPMFIFSGLGGAWVPLEVTGKTFQFVGHFTPVAWALDGFKNIIVRGMGIGSVWLAAAALLGYAVLFCGLAVWKFRFE